MEPIKKALGLSSEPAAPTPTHIEKVSILGRDSIHVGYHLVPYIVETVLSTLPASAYVLFTDTNLAPVYLQEFEDSFAHALDLYAPKDGPRPRWFSFQLPPGEQSKSREMKAQLEDFLLKNKCTRDTVVLALGGGVVGDLVGFVAATFMRGVRYCQIPTTLLAMVDSAVGGKTAIDTPLGKNLIGSFYQPAYVFIDPSFLESLPRREFCNGMAEVVKTAAIWDVEEFEALDSGAALIHAAVTGESTRKTHQGRTLETRTEPQSLLLRVIKGSIATKAHIVTIDEKETGLRNLVNFGHTIGHAIEAVMTPDVLHGECVSVGIMLEAEVARSLGHLKNSAVGRLARCLKSHGLPISLHEPIFSKSPKATGLTVPTLMDFMKIDKKNAGATKKIVLLSKLGKTYEEKATGVEDSIIEAVLSPALRVLPGPGKANVTLSPPGSKSISNRALVLAALGSGECRLTNLLHSDDTQVMMTGLEDMKGASFTWAEDGEVLVVKGGSGKVFPPEAGKEIYLGNAGTASRFLTTVCAIVTPTEGRTSSVITGNARMKQRPIGPLVDALLANGSSIEYLETKGSLPLSIKVSEQGFRGGRIQLAASVSSQYVSSILMCAPYAKEPVILELTGGVVISQPYIDLTISMMASFGIMVERLVGPDGKPADSYKIPQGTYINPAAYEIESDASSATYPLAIAAITGTTCTISNIGSSSLQGDARFAKDVLERMGCKVEQTATSTTVTGPAPGQLQAIGEVDMEPMTDAFLTAAVLAAVASTSNGVTPPNSTRIHGIANQRVKECDRIAAMRIQLAKFGVVCKELDDGIEVFGIKPSELKPQASVFCYDDHRVAMAFSVLSAVPGGPGGIIEEKRCVEKTWPSWWNALSSDLGIKSEAVDLEDEAIASTSRPKPRHSTTASIMILGMRGAGKTHVSKIGAAALKWPVVDADQMFLTETGVTASQFVHTRGGWPAFRLQETAILRKIVSEMGTGHIVSLGGGVCETPENRAILKAYGESGGPIIHVIRDIDDIVEYLSHEPSRPSLGEDLHQIYARRKPWFHELSNFEFVNVIPQEAKATLLTNESLMAASHPHLLKGCEDEIARYFRFMTGVDTNHVDLESQRTSFIALTLPTITAISPAMERFDELTAGIDAIELRVDLLSPDNIPPSKPAVPEYTFVAHQLASLRQRSTVPIIYTVRTVSQGGKFPDEEEDKWFELMELGIKSGCEYIDVEMRWDPTRTQKLVEAKQSSKVIASWHDWTGRAKWEDNEMKQRYAVADRYGDVIKFVLTATSLKDNISMLAFRDSVAGGKPMISMNMGLEGKMSRILNPTFTPVTHSLLPSAAAPGQLSFAEVQQGLYLLGQSSKKHFCIFGTPTGHSKSPLLHNTGYQTLGLPHFYDRHETAEVDDSCRAVVSAPDFGGASVTIPHKLAIRSLLDEVTPRSELIGAVNTIIPFVRDGKRLLRGDNTDWLGIKNLLDEHLTLDKNITDSSTALILGAGGTCRAAIYALHMSGFKTIYLFNRTIDNARDVALSFPKEYNVIPLTVLDAFPGEHPAAVVSTIPATGTATVFAPSAEAGVTIPASVLSRPGGGVVIDAAYKPKRTPLIDLAERVQGWKGVPGIMMLLEQGYEQFHLWTGLRAPKQVIERAVLEAYEADMKMPPTIF